METRLTQQERAKLITDKMNELAKLPEHKDKTPGLLRIEAIRILKV